jgi:hypothetical protein
VTAVPDDAQVTVTIEEVRPHLSERGALELELAGLRAQVQKLGERLQAEVVRRVTAENELARADGPA